MFRSAQHDGWLLHHSLMHFMRTSKLHLCSLSFRAE